MIGTTVPSEAYAVTTVVRPAHPLARALAGGVDFSHGLGLAGLRGRIRIGEPASLSARFGGDLGPLQFFRGAAALLPRGKVGVTGFNIALPGTSGPPASPNPVLDVMAANTPPEWLD